MGGGNWEREREALGCLLPLPTEGRRGALMKDVCSIVAVEKGRHTETQDSGRDVGNLHMSTGIPQGCLL